MVSGTVLRLSHFGGHASLCVLFFMAQQDTALLCRYTEAQRHAIFVPFRGEGTSNILAFNNDSSFRWLCFHKFGGKLSYCDPLSKKTHFARAALLRRHCLTRQGLGRRTGGRWTGGSGYAEHDLGRKV